MVKGGIKGSAMSCLRLAVEKRQTNTGAAGADSLYL
jgi:hypothetical protein